MKLCNSCVMPETTETQLFDSKGTCSVCNQQNTKKKIDWENRQIDLDKLIEQYKNKHSYDCIVPFSGGKDSVFTLWYLVKIKKLKALAVRFDHNFLRKQVNINTEKALKKLGVDFINFKPNFEIVKKMMKESFLRRGDFCWHCHVGIAAFPINTAIKKKIPLIFYGEPSAEYSSFYSYDDYEVLDVEKFNKSGNLGINAEDMLDMLKDRYPNETFSKSDIETYIFPDQRELNVNGIKAVYLGSHIPWDVKKQVEIIKNELDWRGDIVEGIPEEYDYEKIECMMQGVRDYIKFIKRGFGRTSHLVSIDIRNNRLDREKGLDLVKMYDGKKPKALETFLKILEITEDEFYDIAETHLVYPNKLRNREELKKSVSNIVPKDINDWKEKFE